MEDESKESTMNSEVIWKSAPLGVALLCAEVAKELQEAQRKHLPMNSLHEGYAVILEELSEFWAEVCKKRQTRDLAAARGELIQVAAMCLRTILDVIDRTEVSQTNFRYVEKGSKMEMEKQALHREVNGLRAQLGLGRKYIEWSEDKKMGGCPVSGT